MTFQPVFVVIVENRDVRPLYFKYKQDKKLEEVRKNKKGMKEREN